MKFLKTNFPCKTIFFYGFVASICISVLILTLSFLLPALISSNYYQKSLEEIRRTSISIKKEFSQLIEEIHIKSNFLSAHPFPENKDKIFDLFKQFPLNTEKEGIAYYNKDGKLTLWLGNVVDLNKFFQHPKNIPFLQNFSLCIQDKASVFLVFSKPVNNNSYVVFYRLLAFLPQFQTKYLKEYHFLNPNYLRNCEIDYWDFREDVSAFEKIFAKFNDEYIGQPPLQGDIQTIFFPLRSEENKIVATVTLTSPPLPSKTSNQRESLLLLFHFFLGLSLVFLIFYIIKSTSFFQKTKFLPCLCIVLSLGILRSLFLPLSQLKKIQALDIFSPSVSGFFSFLNFTKSPADIFLTAFFLFLIICCAFIYIHRRLFTANKNHAPLLRWITLPSALLVSFVLIATLQEILNRIVFHSSLNLLRFSWSASFILLHISIILFFLIFFIVSLTCIRIVSKYFPNMFYPLVMFSLLFLVYFLLFKKYFPTAILLFHAALILFILVLAFSPKTTRQRIALFTGFLLMTLLIYFSIHLTSSYRNRSILQNSLQNIIKSQEQWALFFLEDSFQEIDKRQAQLLALMHGIGGSQDLAHSIWERTSLSKFNWYSSFEIFNPEGKILSSFSLNIPEIYQTDFTFPSSPQWSISQQNIQFMGKEKAFLIGYKDWFEDNSYAGRTILYISVDYDMLPFLYSANPYFELLRVTSLPSLEQIDFGFAIYDLDGKFIFNPHKLSSGISVTLLQKIQSSEDSIWITFKDKNKKFTGLSFKHNKRIYSLFIVEKSIFKCFVDLLKLLLFYLLLFSIVGFPASLILSRKKIKNPFWSFSNRVYISFIAIALIPLLLFTLSTRNFFNQLFTQKFTENAEEHANIAHRVMEDYIFLQKEEGIPLSLIPENLLTWISSTISNDVNFYQDGKIVSSSRREFFDYGLLPELIDGEVYYKIQRENNPFYTQTQKIGSYSFRTLTIPYPFQESLLLISLPFPLERQEISKAVNELIDFFFFISVLFIVIVFFSARALGRTIILPIKKLLKGTKEVSLGNLETSLSYKPQDEMKTLIDGFNTMVKNLKQHQQELAEISKKVAWAEMARKVAHEVKNPLTPIQLSAEHLVKVYEDKKGNFEDTLKESVTYIIKEVENLRKTAQDFLEISKEPPMKKEAVNVKKVLQETIHPYKNILFDRITFKETYTGDDFTIIGEESKIKTAIRNIITNAIEAIPDHGEILIDASSFKTQILIKIRDTGIGIQKNLLKKIFDPYFSTKDVGTGLGLPIAKKIIENSRGSIMVLSEEHKGTSIIIKLPRAKQ
ncbi:MAG: HAMP domain-containing histidine kinase [Candidatus Aminicenantes bacterium]|nr:HAMP domain-containing histidine kinase [Candidatus Aminicenantes bacterium]